MIEKVTDSVYNIGVNDRDCTMFEGQYHLENGMAYNSYLILDEKTAVVDSVDAAVTEEWMSRLKEGLKDRSLDYIVIQHMEPDHSGSFQVLLDAYPDAKILCTAAALNMMKQFLPTASDLAQRVTAVKEKDTLELGSHTLTFLMAPMVHWPEVMVSYDPSEKILFSADAFGKFGTRDADEDWTCEARRYYFNIVGKYGAQVQALLKKTGELDVKTICPLHGPVLDRDVDRYIEKYRIWSSYEPEDRGVLIVCASAHGNTLAAAKELKQLLEQAGVEKVVLSDLTKEDIHEAVEDAFRYDRLVLAAISYDAGLFPAMEEFMRKLQIKGYQKRRVGIVENGSWAPSAGRVMKAMLEELKNVEIVEPMVTIRSSLNADSRTRLAELAGAMAK
ncbi:FprA family A-type flavoprotein [[Clostridium] aminophilum]|uniref:FprA family A-type flavoprotein n=1 Tax=[Clostridium] aminophilum TaxID=1526 RepID=UPI003320B3E9